MTITIRKRGDSSTISVKVQKDNPEEGRDLAEVIRNVMSADRPTIDFEAMGYALRDRGYRIVKSSKQTLQLEKSAA